MKVLHAMISVVSVPCPKVMEKKWSRHVHVYVENKPPSICSSTMASVLGTLASIMACEYLEN